MPTLTSGFGPGPQTVAGLYLPLEAASRQELTSSSPAFGCWSYWAGFVRGIPCRLPRYPLRCEAHPRILAPASERERAPSLVRTA